MSFGGVRDFYQNGRHQGKDSPCHSRASRRQSEDRTAASALFETARMPATGVANLPYRKGRTPAKDS